MNPLALAGTAVCVGSLAISLWAEQAEKTALRYVFKPLASMGFLTVALTATLWGSAFAMAIVAALVCSFFGDVFLMWRERATFLAGLVSFLLGHVAFAAAFVLGGLDYVWLGTGAPIVLFVSVVVARHILVHVDEAMRGPVIAYMTVITLMVMLSISHYGASGRWWVPAGAIAFYASDISVARDRFVGRSFGNRLWGLPTYYFAQLLFAWGVAS